MIFLFYSPEYSSGELKPQYYVNLSDLTVTVYYILAACELAHTHRAARVHLLCGNAYLRTKPEFAAIRKAGGGVYIHRSRIHLI